MFYVWPSLTPKLMDLLRWRVKICGGPAVSNARYILEPCEFLPVFMTSHIYVSLHFPVFWILKCVPAFISENWL